MKKQDIYPAVSIGPTGIRIQSLASLMLPEVPEWLNDYPEVLIHEGKTLLRSSREWVKQTHLAVKREYHLAVDQNNEPEANRLMEGLNFLNKYFNALPRYPDRGTLKPIGWHFSRFAIWVDILLSGGIKDRHATAMLDLARKYGVDYYGNVYKSGW